MSYVHSEDSHLYKFIHLSKLLLDPHLEDAGFGAPLWSGGPAMEVRKFGAPLPVKAKPKNSNWTCGQGFDGESRPSMGY